MADYLNRALPNIFARPGKILFLELGSGENGYDTRHYSHCEMNIGISDDGKDRALVREIEVTADDFPVDQSNVPLAYRVVSESGSYYGTYKHARSANRKANRMRHLAGWQEYVVEPVILAD